MAYVTWTKRFITGNLEGLDVRVGFSATRQSAEQAARRLRAMANEEIPGKDAVTRSQWLVVPGSVEVAA